MGFFSIFKKSNDYNEKVVIGFMSFMVMVIAIIVDLVTGYMGKELLINEFIFDGFMVIILGSFGIASVDKFMNKKDAKKEKEKTTEETPEEN